MMVTCEFFPDKECRFPHKCRSLWCAEDREKGQRTIPNPWEKNYTKPSPAPETGEQND